MVDMFYCPQEVLSMRLLISFPVGVSTGDFAYECFLFDCVEDPLRDFCRKGSIGGL